MAALHLSVDEGLSFALRHLSNSFSQDTFTNASSDLASGITPEPETEMADDPGLRAFFRAQYIYLFASLLSLVAVTAFSYHQVAIKAYRKTAHRLLLAIAFTDFWVAVVSIFDSITLSSVDLILAFKNRWWTHLLIYLINCTAFWVVALLAHTLLRISHKLNPHSERTFEVWAHIIVWSIPLPFALYWNPESPSQGLKIATVSVRMTVLCLLTLGLVYCQREVNRNPTLHRGILFRVSGFLFAFIICYLPLTLLVFLSVTGISDAYDQANGPNNWTVACTALMFLWGFVCVFLYGANRSCFRRFGKVFRTRKPRPGLLADLKPGSFQEGIVVDISGHTLKEEALASLQVYEELGWGGQGVVYHGLWRGTHVAVKQIKVTGKKKALDPDVARSLESKISTEAEMLSKLRHPRVVLFMGAGVFDGRVTIITEYCQRGSLFDVYSKSPARLSWTRRLKIARDAAEGLLYLHSLDPPCIHRDIKSMNILIDSNFNAKIGDFGTSRIMGIRPRESNSMQVPADGKSNVMTQLAGTLRWMAPEILRGHDSYTSKADVYSFGMMLFELLSFRVPFDEEKFEAQVKKQVTSGLRPTLVVVENHGEAPPYGFVQLIQECWQDEPQSRPTIDVVLSKLEVMAHMHQIEADRRESNILSRSALSSVLLSGQYSAMEPLDELSSMRSRGSYVSYLAAKVDEGLGRKR